MTERTLRIALPCAFLLLATAVFATEVAVTSGVKPLDQAQLTTKSAGPHVTKAKATQAAAKVAAPATRPAGPNFEIAIPALSPLSLGALAVAFAAVGAGVLRRL